MADLLALTRRMLRALEEGDEATLESAFADDVVQIEWPNRLTHVLRESRYELHHAIVGEDEVAYECTWTATLAVPVGSKNAGDTMRAQFAVFLRFRDSKIVSQRNYDCFDPF